MTTEKRLISRREELPPRPVAGCIPDGALSEAELSALHALGYESFTADSCDTPIAGAYRAGFRDGREPVDPLVFHEDDPEPGPDTTHVMDRDGDMWERVGALWGLSPDGRTPWPELVENHGPMVACDVPPDWLAIVEADEQRRTGSDRADEPGELHPRPGEGLSLGALGACCCLGLACWLITILAVINIWRWLS